MKFHTRKFGEIDIADEKIINMPLGLPGFLGRTRFVLLERMETRPFCWFQSVDDPNLALVIMNPFLFHAEYSVDIEPALKEMAWKGDPLDKMAVYVVLTFHDDGLYRITANLIGPIIINTTKCEAVQMVLHESPYSHRHPVMEHPKTVSQPGNAVGQ
ncbi:MAG: flagellar assembly protein FliW [Pseudomonadota bacterium]